MEQHLTISASGRVWFTGYKYANGFGKFEICRRQQLVIAKPVAMEIMALFSQYVNSYELVYYATDIGIWEMAITDIEGKSYNFKGSLCGGVSVGDINLTYYLREQIPDKDLFVFDQSLECDTEVKL